MYCLESFHLLTTESLVTLTLAPSSALAQATRLPTTIQGADPAADAGAAWDAQLNRPGTFP